MPDDSQREALELQKLEAEIAKARADTIKSDLEAAALRKRWVQPAILLQVLVILGIIVTGIVTGVVGHVNGWFSTHLESLQVKQEKAEIALDKLNERRSALNAEIALLTSERDGLARNLKQVLAGTEALQRVYKAASAKEEHCEQSREDLSRLSAQLKTNINQLASAQSDKAINGTWQPGDIVEIRVVLENAGPPPDLRVTYPLSEEEMRKINSSSQYKDLAIESPECSMEAQPGTCQYKIGRAAMVLGYFRVSAYVASMGPAEVETIPNGKRQWTVTMKGELFHIH
jgi:hypothetical protein